jgi:hypothetical protein
MKYKFQCKSCKRSLIADLKEAGTTTACPKCDASLKIPYPGIGIGLFWLYLVMIICASGVFSALFPPAGIVGLGFLLWIKYLRVINIGLHPAWGWFGLVPFISTIWFGVASTGSVKRK